MTTEMPTRLERCRVLMSSAQHTQLFYHHPIQNSVLSFREIHLQHEVILLRAMDTIFRALLVSVFEHNAKFYPLSKNTAKTRC